MASVDPWKWRTGRGCEEASGPPPHGAGCRCKVYEWRARWRTPGGASRSKVCDRKGDADALVAEMETARRRNAYIDPAKGRTVFEAFADDWAAGQDWKQSTRENVWPGFRGRLVATLGGMRLLDVDQLALKRLRADLVKAYAHTTASNTWAYAVAIMRAAYAAGYIGRDPTLGLKAPKPRDGQNDGRVTPHMVPTRAEALAILSAAPKWRAAVALGLAGLRAGEVLGVTADRVAIDSHEVTIDRQASPRKGRGMVLQTVKNERPRTIIVPQLVAVELRRHLRERPTGLLFPAATSDDTPTRHAYLYDYVWRPALKAAGLAEDRYVFHSCRHHCASTLLAEGVNLAAVAGYLGDTIETVAGTYAHWLDEDRAVPASVLDRVLAPVVGRSSAPVTGVASD